VIELHWTEIDGVPTVWTRGEGPLRAGLLFRSGRADETLVTSGQTHLVEHMALSTISDPARCHNGVVGPTFTGFGTMGRPEDVSAFVSSLCDALAHLPSDRLETEKDVLAAEAAARSYDAIGNLLVWRYGAAGHGLSGLPEFGLRGATMQQLHELTADRFTRGNAVFWLSGPPPGDLRLDLPEGTKRPMPTLSPVMDTYPTWFVDDRCGGLMVSATVPRVDASSAFCEIALVRLREELRTKRALSYAPAVFYEPLDAETAHLVLYADAGKDRRKEMADAFGEVFEGLSEVSESEVAAASEQLADHWVGPLAPPPDQLALQEGYRAAMDHLFDREFESLESLAAGARRVSKADVEEFGASLPKTAILALPSGATIRPWIGAKAPMSTVSAVSGREVRSVDAPINRELLVHGADGVTMRNADGSSATVRYSALSGALLYDDGGICLIGTDGATLTVEPTLWRHGARVRSEIRDRVPGRLLIDRGERPRDSIPQPSTTRWQRLAADSPRAVGWLVLGVAVASALAVLVYLGPTAARMLAPPMDPALVAAAAIFVLVPLAVAFAIGYVGFRLIRDRRAV
jgi:zinc protease